MRFFQLTRELLPRWQSELCALEQRSLYPLGDDAFRLSHGDDYFAFFERMGRLSYYAMEDGGRLVAVGAAVLRADHGQRRWYLADVKVHPEHRKRHLPISMLRRAFLPHYLRSRRGYGVAMNPPDGRTPPAVRLLAHFKWVPWQLITTTQLDIYAADAGVTREVLPLLESARGAAHFVSLRGMKDLLLESTHAPLPLLHVRFGPPLDRAVVGRPEEGHTHMWCLPRAAALAKALAQRGATPSASATIVHHGLSRFDWSTLDTSEI